MSLWRIGWASLLGALAGATLFSRPAKGRQAGGADEPDPACTAPDRRHR